MNADKTNVPQRHRGTEGEKREFSLSFSLWLCASVAPSFLICVDLRPSAVPPPFTGSTPSAQTPGNSFPPAPSPPGTPPTRSPHSPPAPAPRSPARPGTCDTAPDPRDETTPPG